MNKTYLVVILAVVCGFAEAKVAIFSNEDVVQHVLKSAELAKFKSGNSDLGGLELSNVGVAQSGGPGIGTRYSLDLTYQPAGVGLLTVCYFTAKVESIQSSAPMGITASELSVPSFGRVKCVY
jgi:hypothetical protein